MEPDQTGKRLAGYSAVWDSPSVVTDMIDGRLKTFTEVIRRGAFRKAIESKGDVIATFNHNPERLLGRTSSGTLELHEDDHGLRFSVLLPEGESGLRELVQRGDLRGASFTFTTRKNGERWDGNTRELTDLYLYEIGAAVVTPAYPATSVGLRSKLDLWKLKLDLARRL